jgi:uncharacterized membrane protein
MTRAAIRFRSVLGWFAPVGVFALGVASLGPGCLSPDDPLDPLDPNAMSSDCGTLTYDNFAAQFFSDFCLRCHSSTLVGDVARSDAPLGIDFDTLEGVTEFRNRIRLRAGELGDMPPLLTGGRRPTQAERQMLIDWLDCDLPAGP